MGTRLLWEHAPTHEVPVKVLLIGPYDPHCGEYTFLAPPLGIWRLKGNIDAAGHEAHVFDPNCCEGAPEAELEHLLNTRHWDVVGISTTGMTLKYDLSLAYLVRRHLPDTLLVAGGMEATFDPERVFELAPFDLVILGEGEAPMRALLSQMEKGEPLIGIPGSAVRLNSGGAQRFNGSALSQTELCDAIRTTPYEQMPYERYWDRLEAGAITNGIAVKAEREARLAEIRSVRLMTLNYCPMACTFCSSTNFLHSAQGSVAKVARLTATECMEMIRRVVSAQPRVRSIIFQDDIFVFTNDRRISELCELILQAKQTGDIPPDLEFISTNRIDAMTEQRLTRMRRAGFRVLGFGIESFSQRVLKEFNKAKIFKHIDTSLTTALNLGLTPFLDLILSSPGSTLAEISETVRSAHRWIMAGCEVGMYPYVVPFSGSKMASDPDLKPYTSVQRETIPGTEVSWLQPEHIVPVDPEARVVMEDIVASYETLLASVLSRSGHMPSRIRSMLWIAAALPILDEAGAQAQGESGILEKLESAVEMDGWIAGPQSYSSPLQSAEVA